jgi:lysophospholipase L1-like esterase
VFQSRRRLLITLVLVVVFAPLLVEGAVRVRAQLKFGEYDEIYDLFEAHPQGMLMARPGLDVHFSKATRVTTSALGFRRPELAEPKPTGSVRVAFLGGSTTFCAQATSNETTWPQLLIDTLQQEHPEVLFEYANGAVTGASIADSRLTLKHRLAPLQPDVIVIVHAAKDMADDTLELALSEGVFTLAEHDWLEEHSLLWMLVRKNLRSRASVAEGREAGQKLEYDARASASDFGERLTLLVQEARAVADVVVVATFATKRRHDQSDAEQLKNLTQAFTFTPYLTPAGILDGYAAYNAAIAGVAASTGAAFVGEHDTIPGTDEYFYDSVHFTEAGYEAMAQRFVRALKNDTQFQRLLGDSR